MRTPSWRRALLLAAAMLIVLHAPLYAHSDDEHAPLSARHLRERGEIVSLERIVEAAQTIHPGRLIRTEFEKEHGRYIYEIEMLDKDGTVWELKFDATTGAFIKQEIED